MDAKVYIYIIVMALITYIIRVLPLTLIRKEIKNNFIKSFLYYVPYVALAVMTFPTILYSTSSFFAALVAFIVSVILAYRGASLITVSGSACIIVFILEMIIK